MALLDVEGWDDTPLTEAKPCPFCGSTPEGASTQVYWVECPNCGARTDSGRTRRAALAKWNQRWITPVGEGVDWRGYASTLALALHMQRSMTGLLEAAHTGDAEALVASAGELAEQLRAMLNDVGLAEIATVTWRQAERDVQITTADHEPLVVVRPRLTRPSGRQEAEELAHRIAELINRSPVTLTSEATP